ncbi:hypothetical protein C7B69_18275 [filamentous cyanobacterium Phorm 46]|nr:hypothetical protein C7B69_18275 [filamentous cyanobacterium Phorm 46]
MYIAVCNPFRGGLEATTRRSPLAPLKKGGTRALKVPLLKGDLGGSRIVAQARSKSPFLRGI